MQEDQEVPGTQTLLAVKRICAKPKQVTIKVMALLHVDICSSGNTLRFFSTAVRSGHFLLNFFYRHKTVTFDPNPRVPGRARSHKERDLENAVASGRSEFICRRKPLHCEGHVTGYTNVVQNPILPPCSERPEPIYKRSQLRLPHRTAPGTH